MKSLVVPVQLVAEWFTSTDSPGTEFFLQTLWNRAALVAANSSHTVR
jgi:hypothetical protein